MSAGNPISGYNINNSLRVRSSASAYLNRTPSSAGNRRTWTWSTWVKRGAISTVQHLLEATVATNNANWFSLQFAADDTLVLNMGYNFNTYGTTAKYRDPAAWYHIILAFDSTQATFANRFKLYVNGVQQTMTNIYTDVGGDMPQNNDTPINNTVSHVFGKYQYGGGRQFDGYIAEMYMIDGQQLTASSFGQTDSVTGVWQPKQYAGTYGTNGFYLKFADASAATAAAIGKDSSGNGNNWTPNNISVTSGTTYDAMIDSPTMGSSATQPVGNYCVINPLSNLDGHTISAGNLNISQSSNSCSVFGTLGVSSGKWYWEVICSNGVMTGVADTQRSGGTYAGNFANSCAWNTYYALDSTNTYASGTFSKAGTISGSAATDNDVIGCALDMDAGTIKYYVNGVARNSGNAVFTNITGTVFPLFRGSISTTSPVNFGQRPFAYTPPTGHKSLCTTNLPDSTIKKGNTVMDATLYTGTGSALTVTNAGSFKPDFVWLKSRSNTYNNGLFNSISGVNKVLVSNSTDIEQTETAGSLSSFNSNGFGLGGGSASYAGVNISGATYVAWQWQAGQGTTSSNTSGSITSTVSVSTTAGFSISTYTAQASGTGTVGHGLGVAPSMIICKTRGSPPNSWYVYHSALGNTKYLLLDGTAASGTSASLWNNTSPTSSVFTLGTGFAGLGSMVSYSFAEIAGFSKFGSYTGNGSTDGVFVYLGFRPKYIMVKRTTGTVYAWCVWDSARETYNVENAILTVNTSNAENTGTLYVDFLSNGFKLRSYSNGSENASGEPYIYAAFAENPFKNALAR